MPRCRVPDAECRCRMPNAGDYKWPFLVEEIKHKLIIGSQAQGPEC